jgi:hypothetical protein
MALPEVLALLRRGHISVASNENVQMCERIGIPTRTIIKRCRAVSFGISFVLP